MWLEASIMHCDLHAKNVMVDKTSGSSYIIDFGMAVCISPSMREQLHAAIESNGGNAAAGFDEVCRSFALEAITARGYDVSEDGSWNDDATFLRDLASDTLVYKEKDGEDS
jgi:tRNA A-37 threonylcarbamoyl transferase component Bud32